MVQQAKFRFIQVYAVTREYNDKSYALSVSDFGRKRMVSLGVILVSAENRIPLSAWLSVSAETEISTFGRSLWKYLCVLRSSQCRQKYYIDVRSYVSDVCFCEE